MYSFPYLELVCCFMSSSNCCFPTCIQITQEAGQMVCYSHLFMNFPVSCDPYSQGLGIINKAEIDVFLELSCFFNDLMDVGNLICFSHSQSLPSGSFHKPLNPSPSEGRQNENRNHRKLIKLITWATALSESMKLWSTPCRATWRVLTKCAPLEKGTTNHFIILALRTPWTVE